MLEVSLAALSSEEPIPISAGYQSYWDVGCGVIFTPTEFNQSFRSQTISFSFSTLQSLNNVPTAQYKQLVLRGLGKYSLFLLVYYDIRPGLTLRLFSVCNLYKYLIIYSKLQLVLGILTRHTRHRDTQSPLTVGKIFHRISADQKRPKPC